MTRKQVDGVRARRGGTPARCSQENGAGLSTARVWTCAVANSCQVLVLAGPEEIADRFVALDAILKRAPSHSLAFPIARAVVVPVVHWAALKGLIDPRSAFAAARSTLPTELQAALSDVVNNLMRRLPATHARDARVTATLRYLEQHLSDHLHLILLAKIAGLSVTHFDRLFVSQVGCGVRAYIRNRRLDEGCRLLTQTTLSVKQIAARVGYSAPGAFSRDFRWRHGTTPTCFRRNST
jgi:transcriptional regulator GlxA family with amidase domain